MNDRRMIESKHFTLEPLADGVYACIHMPGGAAYSNAGIIDLGDRTIVVDSFNTLAAGRDLRQAACLNLLINGWWEVCRDLRSMSATCINVWG